MGGRLRKKCSPPPPTSSPDSVLARLDQMDLRLKQLEQNQMMTGPLLPPLPETYFSPEMSLNSSPPQQPQAQKNRRQQKSQVSSVSSAVHDVFIKGSLMSRLRLLESRILQLSFELGDQRSSSGASSSTTRLTSSTENAWAMQSMSSSSDRKQVSMSTASSSWKLVVGLMPWKLGLGRRLHRRMPYKKGKDPKEVLEAAEKKAVTTMKKENKRISSSRFHRKWFHVGC